MPAALLRSLIVLLSCFAFPLYASQVYFVDAGVGSNTYDGSSQTVGSFPVGPKLTIQAGINAAGTGDTVHVDPGTYAENVTVDRQLTLVGSGSGGNPAVDTILSNSGNLITITAGGTDATHQTTIQNLRVTAGNFGVNIDSTLNFVTLDTITATKLGQHGVHVGANAIVTNLTLLNCNLSANDTNFQAEQAGLYIIGSIDGLTITGGNFDDNTYGMYSMQLPVPANPVRPLTHVQITGTTFSQDFSKGIYLEKLDHATLKNIVVNGSGYSKPSSAAPDPLAFFVPPAGIDINLKYSTYGSIVLDNATVTGCGINNATQATAVAIKGRDDSPNYNGTPALLDGVQIVGGTYQTPPFPARPAFSFGNNATDITFSGGVTVTGVGVGVSSYINPTSTAIDLGNTNLAATLASYLQSLTNAGMTASGVNFNITDDFAIEDKIVHGVDIAGLGVVRWKPGNIFVTVNSFAAPTTTTPSLQRAVDAALSGDVVHVQAGTYAAQVVTFGAKTVTFDGPNAGIDPNVGTRVGEAIVNGASLFLTSNGNAAVTLDGLTFDQVSNTGGGVIVSTASANNVTVRCNRFLSPGPAAVAVSGVVHSGWTVTQNRITTVQGSTAGAFSSAGPSGLSLGNMSGLTCSYNFISGTPNGGIDTDTLASSSVLGNRVLNVPQEGIQVSGGSSNVNVAFNEVNNADSVQTADSGGIRLFAQSFTGAVTVQNNIIAGSFNAVAVADSSNDVSNGFTTIKNNTLSANTRGVYRAAGGAGVLNAQANWWGSSFGPADTTNPSGLGAPVSAGVSFTPYLLDGTDTSPLNLSTFATLQASVGFQNSAALSGSGVPTLTSLLPGSATAGNPPLALTVNGTNFVAASTVLFNGQTRLTLFVSSTQLIAVIPDTDLTTAGTFAISVRSPAPNGGTSSTLPFTVNAPNTPPQIVSQATATPNPATPGQTVNFAVSAIDLENQTLTYAWKFGDGATATGATAQHIYTAPGIYAATVVVTDSVGGTSGSAVTVTVAAAATVPNEPLTLKTVKFKTSTVSPTKGTAQLAGSFALPTGTTTLTGGPATVLINGVSVTFTVDAKGRAKSGKNTLMIKGKLKKGVLTSPSVTFTFKGVGDYGPALVSGGRPVGTSGASTIDVQITYGGKTYEGLQTVQVKGGAKGSTAK